MSGTPTEAPPGSDPSPDEESIGRPAGWGDRLYRKAGPSGDQSVIRKPGEAPPDTVSTPVTLADYTQPKV